MKAKRLKHLSLYIHWNVTLHRGFQKGEKKSVNFHETINHFNRLQNEFLEPPAEATVDFLELAFCLTFEQWGQHQCCSLFFLCKNGSRIRMQFHIVKLFLFVYKIAFFLYKFACVHMTNYTKVTYLGRKSFSFKRNMCKRRYVFRRSHV